MKYLEPNDDEKFAFAFLAGCEMETVFLPDGRCVMRTKYPVGVQETEQGKFTVAEFRDHRIKT